MFNYQNFKAMRNVCGLDVHKDNVFVCIDKEKGDKIQFVCDYYDYDGNYHDSYKLGNAFTLGETYLIGDAHFKKNYRVTYCFTDIYQKRYWTPALQWNEN